MSKLCDQVIGVLKETFPHLRVKTEEYINYRNQKLYLDIWVPQLSLAIEVHGRQHDEFVGHFHGSASSYRAAKRRDSLKEEWAGEQDITYVVLREHELPITAEKLLEKIGESSCDG